MKNLVEMRKDLEIVLRAAAETWINNLYDEAFQAGVKRGRFEQSMDSSENNGIYTVTNAEVRTCTRTGHQHIAFRLAATSGHVLQMYFTSKAWSMHAPLMLKLERDFLVRDSDGSWTWTVRQEQIGTQLKPKISSEGALIVTDYEIVEATL